MNFITRSIPAVWKKSLDFLANALTISVIGDAVMFGVLPQVSSSPWEGLYSTNPDSEQLLHPPGGQP